MLRQSTPASESPVNGCCDRSEFIHGAERDAVMPSCQLNFLKMRAFRMPLAVQSPLLRCSPSLPQPVTTISCHFFLVLGLALTVLATNAASTSDTVTPREAHCRTTFRTSSCISSMYSHQNSYCCTSAAERTCRRVLQARAGVTWTMEFRARIVAAGCSAAEDAFCIPKYAKKIYETARISPQVLVGGHKLGMGGRG